MFEQPAFSSQLSVMSDLHPSPSPQLFTVSFSLLTVINHLLPAFKLFTVRFSLLIVIYHLITVT